MEEIKRIDTKNLFNYSGLTKLQKENSSLNITESENGLTSLQSYPRRIVIELTNACNLDCIMCGRSHAAFKPYFFNTDWLNIIEPAFRYAEEVTLMGWGEPSMHPRFQTFLEFASNYAVKKYILTNGVLLDKMSPWIFEYGVNILAISLDGPDEATNGKIRKGSDFNQIISNIKDLVVRRYFANVKPYINTVTTLMKSNIESFPKMVTLAAELGIEEVKAVYLTAFSKELESETLFDIPEKIREIFEIAAEKADSYNIVLSLPHIPGEDTAKDANHKPCHLAWRDLFIGCDGIIRTCMSSENTIMSLPAAGTPFQSGIWNSREFTDFRERVNSSEDLMNTACRTCYQSSCANWNKKHSFIQTDYNFHPDWGSSNE